MGTQDSVQAEHLLAGTHATPEDSTDDCTFCGRGIDPESGDEHVEHVVRTGGRKRSRRYCSPSCFIRDQKTVASLE